jgi:hypothetical protein
MPAQLNNFESSKLGGGVLAVEGCRYQRYAADVPSTLNVNWNRLKRAVLVAFFQCFSSGGAVLLRVLFFLLRVLCFSLCDSLFSVRLSTIFSTLVLLFTVFFLPVLFFVRLYLNGSK